MARYYALPRDLRVCLRLPRVRDRDAVRELLARIGVAADELALVRLVNFDPRRRLVICATALIESAETIVGVGAIDLHVADPEPSLLLADPRADGLAPLLGDALVGRTRALARTSARAA